MTRDDSLEVAIAAVTALMRVCAEYHDLHCAKVAVECQRTLIGLRSPSQIDQMEQRKGLAA